MQQIHAAGYRVSILINNAGCGACGLFGSVPVAEHRQVICLGALALTELTHLCLPDLQACQGRILQLSSTGAFQPGPYTAVYYATKSYVHSFSLALAHELKPSGVSVSILCPGAVATGFSRTAGKRDVAGAMRPEQVAAYAAPRLMKRRKLLIPGLQNKLVIFFSKFLPGSWTAAMVAAIQKPLLNDQKGKGDS
jgi:short-subunit dehydrogenase